MEDKYNDIKIGVFGGQAQHIIGWLKHLYKFFTVDEYNGKELTEKLISKPNFNIWLHYKHNTITLQPFNEKEIKIEIKKRSEESIEEDLHLNYDTFIMDIHFAFIIKDDRNGVYQTHFNKLFSNFFLYVSQEMQSIEALDFLEQKFLPLLKQINEINKHYVDFNSVAKEKHYNTFFKYAGKYLEFKKMEPDKLEGLFNYYEQFSFDDRDYSDESVMLLQVFATQKIDFEKKKFSPYKLQCDCYNGKECRTTQRIVPYNITAKMFLCESCLEKSKGRRRCFVCLNYPLEVETIRPFCCKEKVYCLACMLDCINKQSYLINKMCLCGKELDDGIVQSIRSYGINYVKK